MVKLPKGFPRVRYISPFIKYAKKPASLQAFRKISNETGYRYLGQIELLKTVTKLGIAIEAKQ